MVVLIKAVKWIVLSILALVLLVVLFSLYQLFSFDTETLPENHGQVAAVLYQGEGPDQPLLVGLGGAEGGNAWARDMWRNQREQFINQGYAFLALGYFGSEGTPAALDRIALEGVHQAILDAASQPGINGQCIALIGGSKGAELALLLASHYPDIKAVVALTPGHAVFAANTSAMNTSSFSLDGQPLPYVPVPWSATSALIQGDLRAVWEEMLKNEAAVERAAIAVENINGPILLVSASEDEFWPSAEMSDAMVTRLQANRFRFPVEHLAGEGDHGSVLNHFDAVEDFLQRHFLSGNWQNGCTAGF